MKKVLIIANNYPPMGGPGVQRSCKFVKYLRAFNYEPIVLTRETKQGVIDQSLLDDVGEHTIYRTKAFDLGDMPGILSKVGRVIKTRVMIPDGDYLWSRHAFKQAVSIIKKEKIDIIYTTSFPYSSHLLGTRLKAEFPEIPWVVDFRDEWTKNPYILDKNYPAFRGNKEKAMETSVVNTCDHFIANTYYMMENFLLDYKQLEGKSSIIHNGYDDSDFADFDMNYSYGDKFLITHAGAMYGRRNPDKFFDAMRNLIDRGDVDIHDIHMQFIGDMNVAKTNEYIAKYNLKDNITMIPYLPHKKAIEGLVKSDALLLVIGVGPGAKNFASGKIFEYINANRPILALVPKVGAAADIIRKTNTGVICDHEVVEEIEVGIKTLYDAWKSKNLKVEMVESEVQKFHRKELTRKLASIFDDQLKDVNVTK